MTPGLSAVVLAGGESRRMGQDKGLLEVSGTTLLARTVRILQQLSGDVLVVGRTTLPADCPPVRSVADGEPGMGPLVGLCTGLHNVSGTYVICVGCDFPFLRGQALTRLAGLAPGWEAVVPVIAGRGQFTHAVYERAILPHLRAEIGRGELSLRGGIRSMRVRWVSEEELLRMEPNLESLRSVNTKAEWGAAEEAIQTADYSRP